jgi:hypothetical protein
MKTKIRITGIVLFVGDEAFNADLFQQGETYIFNANQHNVSDQYEGTLGRSYTERTGVKFARILEGERSDTWFDRRGVFVVHQDDVRFSVEALEYMERDPS